MIKCVLLLLSVLSVVLYPDLLQAQTAADGDFDGSGTVDFPDFIAFAGAFGSAQAKYDLDGNGTVDFADFLAFVQVFGQTVIGVPAAPTEEGIKTVFAGGTLDDLRALDSGLNFDHLVISGPLTLPLSGSVTLRVKHLTITSAGSVGYTHTECEHGPAPDFKVVVTGNVAIDGSINLIGESGTRVSSGAACNSCFGRPGGDVHITAEKITITGSIQNWGGSGSASSSRSGSSGCSAGDAGAIHLEATHIILDRADISTRKGKGGTGFAFGSQNSGSDGEPGPIELFASDRLQMVSGSVSTDGTLSLQAGQTDIYGPMVYGQLKESIGAQTDQVGPALQILSPLDNSTISPGEPLEILIQVSDSGTGVKEVGITGFGYDQVHPTGDIDEKGRLRITIPNPTVPATLQVTAWDNKGNSTSQSVSGLSLSGGLTIAAGEIFSLEGDLDLGPNADIGILGTMVIKRGSESVINAGSLTITDRGRIELEEPADSLQDKAPSLSIFLTGAAKIDGTIDLSGHAGLDLSDLNGEEGGDFSLNASSISISDSLLSNGGKGTIACTRRLVRECFGGDGSKAGTVKLTATEDVQISGTISVKGGDGVTSREPFDCSTGGDGGTVLISYGTVADVSKASFLVDGGKKAEAFGCNRSDAAQGRVTVTGEGGVNGRRPIPGQGSLFR